MHELFSGQLKCCQIYCETVRLVSQARVICIFVFLNGGCTKINQTRMARNED